MTQDYSSAKASVDAETRITGETPRRSDFAAFETFLDELAAAFVRIAAPDIDTEIENWLQRLVQFFDADRSALGELGPDGFLRVTHGWTRAGYESPVGVGVQELPWLVAKLQRGEIFSFSNIDEIPQEASGERRHVERVGVQSHVSIPLMLSGQAIGSLAIAWIRRSHRLPAAVLQRMRLIGSVFGNALARKRAMQEYMQLSRTLQHAGRVAAIGQLASSFAHEIKQPIGASLTNAQTALRLLDTPHPDLAEIRAALEDIVDDNRRAGDIVHEWRRFMRRHEPSLTSIAVMELFDAVVHFVAPEARNQGVNVDVGTVVGFPRVLADRVQIQQVFVNLLLNAFDALNAKTPGQRRVFLAATPALSNRMTFSVSDSGAGVSERLRTALFEPFVTTKPQGLGMGLAIAQTIVRAHGSELSYSDARGGGAVFTFSLAIAPRELQEV
jgi:signal transduction histidine kinase